MQNVARKVGPRIVTHGMEVPGVRVSHDLLHLNMFLQSCIISALSC